MENERFSCFGAFSEPPFAHTSSNTMRFFRARLVHEDGRHVPLTVPRSDKDSERGDRIRLLGRINAMSELCDMRNVDSRCDRVALSGNVSADKVASKT